MRAECRRRNPCSLWLPPRGVKRSMCMMFRRSSRKKSKDISHRVELTAVLTEDLLLLTTSWLKSSEATHFRATSRTSRRLVVRNIPVSTADFAYCEAVTRPGVNFLRHGPSFEERPHLNHFSPLRCWQFRWADIDARRAPHRLFRDKGFVLAMVSQNGSALEYAAASLRSDKGSSSRPSHKAARRSSTPARASRATKTY